MSTSNTSSNAQPSMPIRLQPRLSLVGKVPAFSLLPAPGIPRPVRIAVVGNRTSYHWIRHLARSLLVVFGSKRTST